MLRLCGGPFRFSYVNFRKKMQKTPEFRTLSRWSQVPVLRDGDRVMVQSGAIVEHLSEALGRFGGAEPETRQAIREWLYWDVDVLFPPIFGCYGVVLGETGRLPIRVDPVIAEHLRRKTDTALLALDAQLAGRDYLCADEPTIADIFCYGDIAIAVLCKFNLDGTPGVAAWATRIAALPGFLAPFELLDTRDATIPAFE